MQSILENTVDSPKKEPDKSENVAYSIRFSFTITYILLLTTGTITFIEAIRTKDPFIRHIFNLETCVSIVAGYFYSLFIAKIDETDRQGISIDWKQMILNRYIDWAITTPLMLLVLSVFISHQTKTVIYFPTMIAIVVLDWLMLWIGYLGEIGALSRWVACLGGFVPFFVMFGIMYRRFVQPRYSLSAISLFMVYLILWGLYGGAFLLEESYKNICYNVLDLIAKCFVGLGLWLYYAKIVRL